MSNELDVKNEWEENTHLTHMSNINAAGIFIRAHNSPHYGQLSLEVRKKKVFVRIYASLNAIKYFVPGIYYVDRLLWGWKSKILRS